MSLGVVAERPPGIVALLEPDPFPGLADRLIHHRHRDLGASTLTFDRVQGRLERVEVLGSGPAS